MKKINFISTLSPDKQYELRRWYRIVALLLVCSIMMGGYLFFPLVNSLMVVRQQKRVLSAEIKKYQKIEEDNTLLNKHYQENYSRETKVHNHCAKRKSTASCVAEIVAQLPSTVQLELIQIDKKEIEIELLSSHMQDLGVYNKKLLACGCFSSMAIVSLHKEGQSKHLRCRMRGDMIFS
jgi:Tfp pilus assembly protein PilN